MPGDVAHNSSCKGNGKFAGVLYYLLGARLGELMIIGLRDCPCAESIPGDPRLWGKIY